MADSHPGDIMRSLLSELATGAIAGDERALVLEHLVDCGPCRQELARLTRAADALLAFAPQVEPQPGFESRVLASLGTSAPAPHPSRRPGPRRGGGGRRRHRAVRLLTAAAIAVTALTGGAMLTHWRDQDERTIADRYRQTLAVADGEFLTAGPLTNSEGLRAGTVFLYQGKPSWVVVTVTAALADGRYEMLVVDREGDYHPAGYCVVRNHAGTSGYQLPLPVSSVAKIKLRLPGQRALDLSSESFSSGY
jgi:hypothetical protein